MKKNTSNEKNAKEDVKTFIINVAQKTFSHFGFKKTTVDDIAQAARKGKSSIYYYFNSKEEIFEAVVEKEATTLITEILNEINTTDDPKEKIKKYILARMNGIKNLGNFYNALKNDYLSSFESIERLRIKYDNEEHNIIKNILQEGIEKDFFKIENTDKTSKAIVTAMKGLEIPLIISDNKNEIEDRLDGLLDILFYGICKY
ncbi:MAG: TetR/AcrR family transcriptional regulator [Bacteroidetes bacterium]|nr:MAG: TetR/AcrR family transcriptional regulator [Bacteroidota bacterium]